MVDIRESFKKEAKGFKDYIILVTVDAKNYQRTPIDILRFLVKDNQVPGVYVTLNKPYEIMQRNLQSNDIDTRLIIFIDATTRVDSGKNENCLFIGSPEKLSDMSVAIDQAVSSIPLKEKFIILDSLNTLGIFNKQATVARFIHFLTAKMRAWKVKGIIITLEKEVDSALMDELMQFSDAKVAIGG